MLYLIGAIVLLVMFIIVMIALGLGEILLSIIGAVLSAVFDSGSSSSSSKGGGYGGGSSGGGGASGDF